MFVDFCLNIRQSNLFVVSFTFSMIALCFSFLVLYPFLYNLAPFFVGFGSICCVIMAMNCHVSAYYHARS
jgi:hypothetical protein